MFLFSVFFSLYNYLLVTVPSQLQLAWTTWSFCIADGVGCSLRCLWLAKCPILLSCDRIITNIFHRCTENMKCMYWRREFIHEQYVPSFLNALFGFAKYQHSCIKAAIHRDKSAKQNLSEYIFFMLLSECTQNIRTCYDTLKSCLNIIHLYSHGILQARFLLVLLSCFSSLQLGTGYIVDCCASAPHLTSKVIGNQSL